MALPLCSCTHVWQQPPILTDANDIEYLILSLNSEPLVKRRWKDGMSTNSVNHYNQNMRPNTPYIVINKTTDAE